MLSVDRHEENAMAASREAFQHGEPEDRTILAITSLTSAVLALASAVQDVAEAIKEHP